MAFSVGMGLTNECNLRCAHCYRPDMVVDRLSLQDVQSVCEAIPVKSMNLGVGENGLHGDGRDDADQLRSDGRAGPRGGRLRRLGSARLVATTEPVLAAVLGLPGFTGPGWRMDGSPVRAGLALGLA